MADVDLLVEVSAAGVPGTLASLDSLQKAGQSTGRGFIELAAQVQQAMSNISTSTASAGKGTGFTGINEGLKSTKAGVTSLTDSVKKLEDEYKVIAAANPFATARQRLTAAGEGSLTAGLAGATTYGQLTGALNASPTADANAVAAEDAQLLLLRTQRTQALADTQKAQADTALVGLTAQQRAQIQLADATTRLADAQAALSKLPASAGRSVATLEAQVAAQRELTAATEQYNSAYSTTLGHANNANSTAFQSSFSYFIIAGLARDAAKDIADMGEAAVQANADIQRSFADVDRTFGGTQTELAGLKQTLVDLATSTPNSFVDLAGIATLGNQLGVAAKDIQSFTTTIAQYTAISGETAEAAATQFGKIGNLTGLSASQFNNLASAIEYTARTTVATESTIASTAQEISALADGAGFSAQAIVGLSGALSSLSIPPERARGALSLYFGALNDAVASGGPKLQDFAKITGYTTDQLTKLVATNQGQQVFTSFISGISNLNTVAKTSALEDLGLSGIRVDQTIRALASNVPLLTSSFAGADSAFTKNTELAKQYATIQDTLTSEITEFQSAVQLAAGAAGQDLAVALAAVLPLLTKLLVGFQRFADSPVGIVFFAIASAIGVVVFAIASLIGALALMKASMVVIPWAIEGLGADTFSGKLGRVIASLLGIKIAAPPAAEGIAAVGAASEGAAVGAEAAAVGMTAFQKALGIVGLVLTAVAVIGTLVGAFVDTSSAAQKAKKASDDYFKGTSVSGISDALIKDQTAYDATGIAISQITTHIEKNKTTADSWVQTLQSATGAQVDLDKGTSETTKQIQNQTVAYGDNAKAALAKSLADSKQFQALFKNTSSIRALQGQGFDQTNFAQTLLGDPVKGGAEYVASLTSNIAKNLKSNPGAIKGAFDYINQADLGGQTGSHAALQVSLGLKERGIDLDNSQIQTLLKLEPAYKLVTSAASATSTQLKGQSEVAAASTATARALANAQTGVGDGFDQATDAVTNYQSALQSGISKFTDFSTIVSNVATKLKIDDASKESVQQFGDGLADANDKAVTFYSGISQLANSGLGSFATQLASIGPDAQGILSSALNLSPEAQQQLEINARFAAFIASDAFTQALQANLEDDNNAYARIFTKTGSLDAVKQEITAQVQGVGDAAEKAWDIANPDLPLNIDLKNPSPADLALFSQEVSGQLTVTATVVPVYGAADKHGDPRQVGSQNANTYTDTATGASITLPATLDSKALSASLAYWEDNESKTPSQIASQLDTKGWNNDVTTWAATNGKIKVYASIVPTSITGFHYSGSQLVPNQQTGGAVSDLMRHFASGGSFGQINGAGTGTSDSIIAAVSAGEYISNAQATNYWGADFFDSLNRRMLPSSFTAMLQAAAVSGNRGPSHVAYVTSSIVNPLTRDPLEQLRQESENLQNGIWG